jgi:NAD(P)-dependent dehydrogenase (short-subunit alcohol dehydrogenase family)
MPILADKVALISGAGQGIGKGIALACAKEGAAIAALGRTRSKLDATCAEIEAFGGRATPVECDVKDGEQIIAAVQRTIELFGHLDILVNNAQEINFGPIADAADQDFAVMHASGPEATFRFMRACYPHLKASPQGAVVNLTSPIIFMPNSVGFGLYAAVKQAIRSITRVAAYEWAADGITVNAIAPVAHSPNFDVWEKTNPEQAAAFVKTIPMGRLGDCERDIGRAVLFLVGPDARYITGATIPLDGGQANFG